MSRKTIVAVFVLAGTIFGCSRRAGRETEPPRRPPLVKAITVHTITHVPKFSALGRAQPAREVVLAPERPGKLIFFDDEIGRRVEKGELVARVRAIGLWPQKHQAEARIQELEVALQKAERDLKRMRKLFKDGVVSKDELEKVELMVKSRRAQLLSARAGLSAVRENLGSTSVLAPFDGEIVEVYQHQGNFVGAGRPLARLVDLSEVKIVVGVSEVDIPYVHVGDAVEVEAAAYPGRRWKAKVHAKSDAVPQNSVSFPVEVRLPNERAGDGSWLIKAGMTMKVWFGREKVRGVFLPSDAVVTLQSRTYVFVLNGNKVKRVPVRLGKFYTFEEDEQKVRVFGLSDGMRVVVSRVRRLKDGMVVRVQGMAKEAAK